MTTTERLKRTAWFPFPPSQARLEANRDGELRIVCTKVKLEWPWLPPLWTNQGRVIR